MSLFINILTKIINQCRGTIDLLQFTALILSSSLTANFSSSASFSSPLELDTVGPNSCMVEAYTSIFNVSCFLEHFNFTGEKDIGQSIVVSPKTVTQFQRFFFFPELIIKGPMSSTGNDIYIWCQMQCGEPIRKLNC